MRTELRAKISEYFREKIAKYGANPKGVDWKDKHSQNLRFEQLLKIIDVEKPVTLNDLGCGYGASFLYLSQETSVKILKYYGYDICPEMLVNARNLVSDERASFVESNEILFNADYSICSGIFNAKLDTELPEWEEFILGTLSNMNEKSSKGFAFNCLTTYVDYKEDHLYYGDPPFFFDFCKKNFSKYVTLIHDYELYEWTIPVRKKFGT